MQKRRGFTTVELVIVIAVIAILATALIPTFAGLIKSANHNVDVQTANSMTKLVMMYAVNNKIESESDLRDAINLEMGEGYYETLSPKSGRYGYHFWYDIENNQFIVKTVEEIDALYQERTSQTHYIPEDVVMADGPVVRASLTSWKESEKHFRSYQKYFFMVDRGGSKVGEALAKLDKAGVVGYSFGDALTALTNLASADGEDKAFAQSAADKLAKTAVVAYGTFQPNATIEHVYISLTAEELSATNTVINNAAALTVALPSNVTKINTWSLLFAVESALQVNATEEELEDMLGADCFENCTITLSGVSGYTVEGATVWNPNEEALNFSLEISESSRVTDMALSGSALVQNKMDALVPNADGSYNLYVAVDYKNALTFSVTDYFGTKELEDGTKEKIIARGTRWNVGKDSNISCTSEKNGTFVITGFADDNTAYAGTITATIQEVTKTIHVYGVKALGITVDTSNNAGLNIRDVDDNNVTITIPYTKGSDTNKWNFKPSLVLNYAATDIQLTGEIKVTDPANALTFANNVLSLDANYDNNASTNLSVNFVDDEDKVITSGNVTYKVKLINQGKESFAKDVHLTTYTKLSKFYVGNAGDIKLEYLFDAIKNVEGQKLFVTISRGGVDITPEPIAKDSLNDTINLSKLTVLDAEYVIEVCVGQEVLDDKGTEETTDDEYVVEPAGAKTSVTVHLVNATNVAGDIGSITSKNIVLVADVTLNTAKSLTNVYGNLHKINSSIHTDASTFWDCLITLSGTMRDTLVIGPVYDTIGFGDSVNKSCGWDGVKLTGNAHITNSYIFGFRAPVSVLGATDVKISDSVIEGGAYANIHVDDAKLTLEDVKLVQEKAGYKSTTKNDAYVYGMGIFCDTDADCTIVLTGDTKQYNWTSVEDINNVSTSFSLSDLMISVPDILGYMINDGAGFVHSAVDSDGNTVSDASGNPIKYINLGIIQEIALTGCDISSASHQIDIKDERTNKLAPSDRIKYEIKALGITVTTKYYDGYSFVASEGNNTISNADFLPAGWTSQVDSNGYCVNYNNFLNEQK